MYLFSLNYLLFYVTISKILKNTHFLDRFLGMLMSCFLWNKHSKVQNVQFSQNQYSHEKIVIFNLL